MQPPQALGHTSLLEALTQGLHMFRRHWRLLLPLCVVYAFGEGLIIEVSNSLGSTYQGHPGLEFLASGFLPLLPHWLWNTTAGLALLAIYLQLVTDVRPVQGMLGTFHRTFSTFATIGFVFMVAHFLYFSGHIAANVVSLMKGNGYLPNWSFAAGYVVLTFVCSCFVFVTPIALYRRCGARAAFAENWRLLKQCPGLMFAIAASITSISTLFLGWHNAPLAHHAAYFICNLTFWPVFDLAMLILCRHLIVLDDRDPLHGAAA